MLCIESILCIFCNFLEELSFFFFALHKNTNCLYLLGFVLFHFTNNNFILFLFYYFLFKGLPNIIAFTTIAGLEQDIILHTYTPPQLPNSITSTTHFFQHHYEDSPILAINYTTLLYYSNISCIFHISLNFPIFFFFFALPKKIYIYSPVYFLYIQPLSFSSFFSPSFL